MQKSKVDVILGIQWGDEGKGKIVDVLAPGYDIVARFQGGPNAGHTIKFGGMTHVLHTIPSGIFHEGKVNVIGNGVLIDACIVCEEIENLRKAGIEARDRMVISDKANLILPTHRLLDAALEQKKGSKKIGSTVKGIGPAYTDKVARCGLRMGDVFASSFQGKYEALKADHLLQLKNLGFDLEAARIDGKTLAEYEKAWMSGIEELRSFQVLPTESVGSGPFPTELHDATGEELRAKGHEFGATTGRPRRTGWLDLPALRYTLMINGITDLVVMKADVMDEFDTVKVAVGYTLDGKKMEYYPTTEQAERVVPEYKELPGWKSSIGQARRYEELPAAFRSYLDFICQETGSQIKVVSVGPDREETIIRGE